MTIGYNSCLKTKISTKQIADIKSSFNKVHSPPVKTTTFILGEVALQVDIYSFISEITLI